MNDQAHTASSSVRRARWAAVVVLSVVGLSGALGGIVLDRTLLRPDVVATGTGSTTDRGGPKKAGRASTLDELARELDLTPDQRAGIESILSRQLVAFETAAKTCGLEQKS